MWLQKRGIYLRPFVGNKGLNSTQTGLPRAVLRSPVALPLMASVLGGSNTTGSVGLGFAVTSCTRLLAPGRGVESTLGLEPS